MEKDVNEVFVTVIEKEGMMVQDEAEAYRKDMQYVKAKALPTQCILNQCIFRVTKFINFQKVILCPLIGRITFKLDNALKNKTDGERKRGTIKRSIHLKSA